MKLEPKAKPVRIRIKSGGEEHFNLESLKRNFSVEQLWESVKGRSLSRWLKQQNETELAEEVEAFSQTDKPSSEIIVKFSSLFFKTEMGGEPVRDANALVKFYKDKNLEQNFKYAFADLLDSLDYANAKTWFDKYKVVKSIEDWITYFDEKLPQLEEIEKVECYRFLSELHKDNKDTKKMEDCLSKQKKLVVDLSKKDHNIADKWLASNDFFYIKAIFEDETAKKTKTNKEWISIFEDCKTGLSETDQAECLYILATLYDSIGDIDKSSDYMKDSAGLGYEEAISALKTPYPRYPELTEVFDRYRKMKNTSALLSGVIAGLKSIEVIDSYYTVCRFCIELFKETSGSFEDVTVNYIERDRMVRRFPIYESLISLIMALAWEQNGDSIELYWQFRKYVKDNSDYKTIFQRKLDGKKVIVKSARGMISNWKKDSIVEQMLFFLETYGEAYNITLIK